MKKIISILLILVLMPITTFALTTEDEFKIGDSVSVSFNGQTDSENLIGFHVLKDSAAGESTVTLIYDGILSEHDANGNVTNAQIQYQIPGTTETPTVFAGSNIQTILNRIINAEGWILASSARLLENKDLVDLGIDTTTLQIPKKYDFLRPADFDSAPTSTTTDYWTQISLGDNQVYVVTKPSTSDISAELTAKNVDDINSVASIKPVIVVNKEYIVCNNSVTPPSVDTGIEDYFLLFGTIIAMATIGYVGFKKKDAFQNI